MHSKLALAAALAAGLLPVAAIAQAAPAAPEPAAPSAASAAAAAPAPVAPQAYPAKIALIAFQQAVITTNEGQQALAVVRKKFEPKQTELEGLNTEIDTLKKKLQAAPATMTDADRSALMKSMDSKQKQLDSKTEEARTAYQSELQTAYSGVAEKVHKVLLDYVQSNGYTMLFDVSNEQSSIMWTSQNPSADITIAVVDAYNKSSGVAAPVPDAPTAPAASRPKPASTTPHTGTKPPAK
jgi:Skp family chaperone for outer membrane proteins